MRRLQRLEKEFAKNSTPEASSALRALVDEAARDADVSVRRQAAAALSQVGRLDAGASCLLLELLRDPAPSVRREAVGTASFVIDEPRDDAPLVRALLERLQDTEMSVRDMAAFAIGSQLPELDSPEVRQRLSELLTQADLDDYYPAAVAAVGLARRGDPAAIPAIAKNLRDSPGRLWLEAAALAADMSLYPHLIALQQESDEEDDDSDDPWCRQLIAAIMACTPR